MKLPILLANVLGWPVLQLTIAWGITRLSPQRFSRLGPLDGVTKTEADFYRRWLLIRKWKARLPDGGQWVGSTFPRERLAERDAAYFSRLLAETRRAELAHWIMMACCPLFFLWNPLWAWPVMIFYAVVANGPCIIAQRYNRRITQRFLSRFSASACSRAPQLC